ncbi:MAG: DUF3570 domain-containing protein [bacterium]|nr:DUF3570 domain-containing protein [bacterium]
MLLRFALIAPLLVFASLAAGQTPDGGTGEGPGLPSEQGETGTRSITVRLSYYDREDDGDGNPFLDEELTVIEPVILFDNNVSDSFGYYTKLSYDNVSSASIDRLSEFPEQSGATGDYYFGFEFGARHRYADKSWLGWHASVSKEYDYTSFGLGGSLSIEPENTDAKLTFSLDGFVDEIDIIRFDGTEDDGTDDRTSFAATGRWYQILSPEMHGEFGLTVSHQSGFLETAYNAVVIEDDSLPPNPNLDNEARGFEITEELPDDRMRTAVFGKVRRYVNARTAVELGGRVYDDDWGITGFSIEPRLYRELVPDELRLRLRYRYYDQSEADFYKASFTREVDERTQDSDLADFTSHTVGAKLIWTRGPGSFWDFGVDYIDRDDGLDHVLATIGWKRSF